MIGSALIFAASAMTVPINERNVVTYLARVVPEPARNEPDWVAATVNLWVEPNGKIARCSLGRFVGNATTAGWICRKLIGMQFGSPRDEQGHKSHAFVPMSFTMTSRAAESAEVMRQLEAQPNRTYPESDFPFSGLTASGDAHYSLILAIGTNGEVRGCTKSWNRMPDEVAESACELARQKTFPTMQSDGETVSHLRYVTLVPQS